MTTHQNPSLQLVDDDPIEYERIALETITPHLSEFRGVAPDLRVVTDSQTTDLRYVDAPFVVRPRATCPRPPSYAVVRRLRRRGVARRWNRELSSASR